jgi:Zn finger protein HypA/HybF involved in hydrogenase expression
MKVCFDCAHEFELDQFDDNDCPVCKEREFRYHILDKIFAQIDDPNTREKVLNALPLIVRQNIKRRLKEAPK